MSYSLKKLKGQESFEVYCILRRQLVLQDRINNKSFSKNNVDNYSEKDLYKLLSCVVDGNKVPFYENRVKNLKLDRIKTLLDFVFSNLKFDLDYKAKLVEKNIEFVGIKSILLFYTLQRLTLYYYDFLTNRESDFVDWLSEFKKDICNCQKLLIDGCLTDKDLKLIGSFLDENLADKDYREIIDNISSIVYYFLNQDLFFINEIGKMTDFSCDVAIKDNMSIQNILALLGE